MGGGKYDWQVGNRTEVIECPVEGLPRSKGTMESISSFHLMLPKIFKKAPFVVLKVSIHQEDILIINIMCLIVEL